MCDVCREQHEIGESAKWVHQMMAGVEVPGSVDRGLFGRLRRWVTGSSRYDRILDMRRAMISMLHNLHGEIK